MKTYENIISWFLILWIALMITISIDYICYSEFNKDYSIDKYNQHLTNKNKQWKQVIQNLRRNNSLQ